MDDQKYKRMMRRFTLLWFISLGLLIFIVAALVRNDEQNNGRNRQYVDQSVDLVNERIDSLPHPKHGIDGRDGVDGTDGVTTTVERHTTEIITKPGIPGPKGNTGPQGEQGKPGRELQMQVNPKTGDLETKYTGDDLWQVLIPCGKLLGECKE